MPTRTQKICEVLQSIAPLSLAEDWDNVGLLVQPDRKTVRRLLLTIDLTPAVLDEAIAAKVQMIVAYHPPIFSAMKRFADQDTAARTVRLLMQKRIALYSPHTALDSVQGGVNDWLADAFDATDRTAIAPTLAVPESQQCKLIVFVPNSHADALRIALADTGIVGGIGPYSECSFNLQGIGTFRGDQTTHPAIGKPGQLEMVEETRLEMVCPGDPESLATIARTIYGHHPYEEPAWELHRLMPMAHPHRGQGRLLTLRKPTKLPTLLRQVKKHLGLKHIRLAHTDSEKPVRTIALCAGAGGSVLAGSKADLYLTGEMRHHDILAANARGTHVLLTDHTNTERGYLPILKQNLATHLPQLQILIAKSDRDPLAIA